jgi:branched-chain amino acid transport system ATP-binding protein
MLTINQLKSGYGRVMALQDISLKLEQGQIVTLIGANGSGKSTLLKSIVGLLPVRSGTISFLGERIDGLPANKIVSKGISLVPEGRQIFPNLTVNENLRMGAYSRKDKSKLKDDYDNVLTFLPILKGRLQQKGGTLSGGEQQALAIARALMSRPKLLLMDEPSLGLAPIVVRDIYAIIVQINQEGFSILLIEQNVKMALTVGQYGYVIESGRIVLEGEADFLSKNEHVQKSYLG